jgi:hypothetical protein
LSLAAAALLVACGTRVSTPSGQDAAAPSRDASPAARGDAPAATLASTFDALVTAEAVFPDAAQRALYRAVPPETQDGRRVYGYELKPQPGMDPKRHFHLVSVAISTAKGPPDAGPSTLAGPNGAFTEFTARTSDGRFDVSASEGNLLPDSVELPAFDLTRAARSIAERYAALQ